MTDKNLFMDVTNTEFLAKGKRGIVYTGFYKGKKAAIKTTNPESKALSRIENEANWLKKLNKYNIGPRLLRTEKEYIIIEFIEGDLILDYLEKSSGEQIIKALTNILKQCRQMDKLGMNKYEMHHPAKHIIIKGKPVLIDFERSRITRSPKNVTQFCQFILSLKDTLENKGIRISRNHLMKLCSLYKKDNSAFSEIVAILKS